MKTTIRILSVILCMAMLMGVFAATVFAEEKGQHVKLIHNASESDRVYIGHILDDEANDFEFDVGAIAAKDLTFDGKITGGANIKIEFYIIWKILDGYYPRYVAVDIRNGQVINATNNVPMGTVPADIDLSEWHTYTVRCSRTGPDEIYFEVQLLIDGEPIAYEGASRMNPQGATEYDRIAIHARSAGTFEIDNIRIEEKYLEEPKGAVKGESRLVWESDFGTLGTEFEYHVGSGYTKGLWKKDGHEGTEVTFVEDEAGPAVTGDASIITMAAMMLPVSGVALGALCIKRRKEE